MEQFQNIKPESIDPRDQTRLCTLGATLLTLILAVGCRENTPKTTQPGATVMHYDHPFQPDSATAEFADKTGIKHLPFPEGGISGHIENVEKLGETDWDVRGIVHFKNKLCTSVLWRVRDNKVLPYVAVYQDLK
ncbi:MAG: hypothetical protein R3A13_02065 [Bdellovibrionota bacterium]